MESQKTFNIYCKRDPKFSLAIRNDVVILAPTNPYETSQHWYKSQSNGKDSFTVVNKATNQAIKHSINSPQPVQLVTYNPAANDASVLWKMGAELGDGYRAIKNMNNDLVWDGENGIIKDGTRLINYPWRDGTNQYWIIEPQPIPVRIYCKRGPDFSLNIKDGKVILSPSSLFVESQLWYKIEDSNKKVLFVNKATGETIKHSAASHKPVELVPYNPTASNESLKWSLGSELEDGYRAIEVGNNPALIWDAAGNDVHDGTTLINHPWHGGSNQRWIFEPIQSPAFKIYCKRGSPSFALTIRDNKVILAPSNPADKLQYWYKDSTLNKKTDSEGFAYFAVVNKATNQAIKHSAASHQQVQLVSYNPTVVDESVLWTQGADLGDGYKAIRVGNNPASLMWDAAGNDVHDGTALINHPSHGGGNQQWIIERYV